MKYVNIDEFKKIKEEIKDQKILAIFHAEWCSYCKIFLPIILKKIKEKNLENNEYIYFVDIGDYYSDVWKETGNTTWFLEVVPTTRIYYNNHLIKDLNNVLDDKTIVELLNFFTSKYLLSSNIHSHTVYCNHSDNEPEKLVKYAKESGFKEFTISEHIPYPIPDKARPSLESWNNLLATLKNLKDKYEDENFKLYISTEAEYYKDDYNYYLEFLKKYDLDFMIFGNHHYKSAMDYFDIYKVSDKKEMLNAHIEQAIDGMKSGLFFHIAHPDMVLRYLKEWNQEIENKFQKLIDVAIENDITLGFNVNGCYIKNKKNIENDLHYPSFYFWKLVANSNAKVRIELDIHEFKMFDKNIINDAYIQAISWGLQNNIVDQISLEEIDKIKKIKKNN